MKNNTTTWETIEGKQNDLVCDIQADLEGISAMAEALHMLAGSAVEDGKMDPYYCSGIYGLQRAIDNLAAYISRRQDALCKERLPLLQSNTEQKSILLGIFGSLDVVKRAQLLAYAADLIKLEK